MSKKILVTGATGTIGKAVVKELKAAGAAFKAASRNVAAGHEKLGSDTEVVAFDFADPTTFNAATEGIDRVFLLGPPLTLELDKLLAPFIAHLQIKGIKRVVYFSALGAEKMGDSLGFHTMIEQQLKRENFDYTILKPTFFAQNFKNYEWENITERGITFVTAGEGKAAFVDVNDIAKVAAKVLTTDGHTGKQYQLTGPELLSYAEAAQILTEVTGKPIFYPNPSPDQYRGALAAAGAPAFVADYMINVYSIIATNEAALLTSDVELLTGQKPTDLKTVLQRDFAA